MLGAGDFVDGVAINWRRLGTVLFGAGLMAWFSGAAATVLSLANLPIGLLEGLADWYATYIATVAGAPATWLSASFAAAESWVATTGPLGYLAGIGVALATLYSLAWVVNNVVG